MAPLANAHLAYAARFSVYLLPAARHAMAAASGQVITPKWTHLEQPPVTLLGGFIKIKYPVGFCRTSPYPNTVVPVMNGHPRDQAKVSVQAQMGMQGTPNIIHLAILHTTITTSDIPNEYTHCHVFYSSKPKINVT